MSKQVKPGDKVKVYMPKELYFTGFKVKYGEALGVGRNGEIILVERSEFSSLPIGEFHHCRNYYEVKFINQ